MRLQDLYEQYHEKVQFLNIYIREAHPVDGWWFGKGPMAWVMKRYSPRAATDVYDPQTKEIVAQIDTAPLDYRLPTTDWTSGELVADEISLSLADLIPGEYELAVGVYNADTGQRLPLTGGTDSLQISEDGRLFLPDQVKIPAR